MKLQVTQFHKQRDMKTKEIEEQKEINLREFVDKLGNDLADMASIEEPTEEDWAKIISTVMEDVEGHFQSLQKENDNHRELEASDAIIMKNLQKKNEKFKARIKEQRRFLYNLLNG